MIFNFDRKYFSGTSADFCTRVYLGQCSSVPVPVDEISQIVLTARNLNENTIIGAHNAQDVFNANGGTYANDADGVPLFTFTFSAADTTIAGSALLTPRETHVFQFTFTTTDGLVGIVSVTIECLALPATALAQEADLGALRQQFRILIGETLSLVPDDDWIDQNIQDGATATNQKLRYAYDDLEITLVAGTAEYELPNAFKSVLWNSWQNKPLQEAEQDFLRRRAYWWRSQPEGVPEQYAIWKKKIIVIPTPNAAAVASDDTLLIRANTSPPPFRLNGLAMLSDEWWTLPLYYAAVQWFSSPMGKNASYAKAFYDLWQARVAEAQAEYLKRGVQ